ncbi:MAG: AAA family ATPase [Streptosporangiales bacterium]|nr:AAA family ATPase [Streptosporangiales bacterium]
MATSGFRERLAQLLRARYPLIYIETHEEQRAVQEICAVAGDPTQMPTVRGVHVWSATTGLAPMGAPPAPDSRNPALALERAMQPMQPSVFVFKDLHPLLGGTEGRNADATVVRRLRDVAAQLKVAPAPGCVILLAPVLSIPVELERDIAVLPFDLPGEDQIAQLLDSMVAANQSTGRVQIAVTRDDRERLIQAARGLTLQEAENAFARALVTGSRLDADDVAVVVEEKRQAVLRSGILEVVQPRAGFDDVGGLENLKRWLAKRTGVWGAAARRYNLSTPKGLLLTGVPGCGKSLSATRTAGLWRVPLLRLDIGRVFAGLVGSSEQNMRTAIRTAEAIAPCVLWIDEIEKGFAGVGGEGGDGGTARRVFGTFLTWLQEKTAPVFVIATANQIGTLPPEFLRKGRFDEIFFVDLPTTTERVPIWRVHLRRRLTDDWVASELPVTDELLHELAQSSEGYSGAEIEQAVVAGLLDAFAEHRPLRRDDLLRALTNTVPLSVTQSEDILALRRWADTRAVSATAIADLDGQEAAGPAAPAEPTGEVTSTRGGRRLDL